MCIFEPKLKPNEMNRFVRKAVFALLSLTLLGGHVNAQFTTTFAKNATPGQQDGLYYSLPQTMLQLDFVIAETTVEEGPLSDYADNYLETSAYDRYEGTTYSLMDVRMTSKATADPNATFFVTFAAIRGSGKPVFDVLPNGIIRSVGVRGTKEQMAEFQSESQSLEAASAGQIPMETPTFTPLLTAGKTNAQLAKEVADKIEEIRKAKFYLISGDVEMATNPETFNAMYAKLDEMEQEYLSLFLGKRVTRQIVRTVYVTPDKETTTLTVAKFSEADGLTIGTTGPGSDIKVQIEPLGMTEAINAPSQSAIKLMSYENKVIYRIPETTNVKVTYAGRTLMEDRRTINQLGVLLMAPLTNSKLYFDTETGQIVNMRML